MLYRGFYIFDFLSKKRRIFQAFLLWLIRFFISNYWRLMSLKWHLI